LKKGVLVIMFVLIILISSGCIASISGNNSEFAFMITTLKDNTYERVDGALVKVEGQGDFWQDYTNKDGKVIINTPYETLSGLNKATVTVKKDGCTTLSREYNLESEIMVGIDIVCQ